MQTLTTGFLFTLSLFAASLGANNIAFANSPWCVPDRNIRDLLACSDGTTVVKTRRGEYYRSNGTTYVLVRNGLYHGTDGSTIVYHRDGRWVGSDGTDYIPNRDGVLPFPSPR
jgi:hypothetical protein